MTRQEALDLLRTHTQYFVPVADLGALNIAMEALQEVINSELSNKDTLLDGDAMTRQEKIEYIERIENQYSVYAGYQGELRDLNEEVLDILINEYKSFEQYEPSSSPTLPD